MRRLLFSCAPRSKVWAPAAAGLIGLWAAGSAAGFTPESPEVKQTVAKAVEFLESDAATDTRMGARALVGLAMLKHGAKPDHRRIVEAVQAIQGTLGDKNPAKVGVDIYSTGMAAIFLITLDPSKYAPEIECLTESLRLRQKPHGGWGYPERETGDTSMTQYAVLSAWEATQAGFRVPPESIEAVAIWLMRTRDPSGGFGYQGVVSSTFAPVPQSEVRNSLSAAGLGSLYICADLLGLAVREDEREDGLPAALKEVKPADAAQDGQKAKTRLEPRVLREAQLHGNRWMAQNYKIDPPQWTHYYLYALERYMSFRELTEKKTVKEKELKWYNDGVRFLIQTQKENGSWESQCKATADTAFGVLFLLRSMKKSIEKARSFGDGMLLGGRGLPKDTAQAVIRRGRVVAPGEQGMLGPIEELLAVLDSPDNPEFDEALETLEDLSAGEAAALAGRHADKLRRLAGGPSPEARIAAMRAIAKSGDLDQVPTLISALADPTPEVVVEARDALRRISRNPRGLGPSDRPTEAERRQAIEQWKAWYLAIRPDADVDF